MDLDHFEQEQFTITREKRNNLYLAVAFMGIHTLAYPLMEAFHENGGFDKVQNLLMTVAYLFAVWVLYQVLIPFAQAHAQVTLSRLFRVELWFNMLFSSMYVLDDFTQVVNPTMWSILNLVAFLLLVLMLVYIMRMPSNTGDPAIQWMKYWILSTFFTALLMAGLYVFAAQYYFTVEALEYLPLLGSMMIVEQITMLIWVSKLSVLEE